MDTNNLGRKRRDRPSIIRDILEMTKGPVRKTRIMYGTNLSFKQLNEYLNFLVERGLLIKDTNPHELYSRTGKAKKFLHHYHGMESSLEPERK